VIETGVPVIVVLINGRPLSTEFLALNASAIIEAWYPGQAMGTAVASVLFGLFNPGLIFVHLTRKFKLMFVRRKIANNYTCNCWAVACILQFQAIIKTNKLCGPIKTSSLSIWIWAVFHNF